MAIRELVERWVDRRVTSLRLDERERAQWDHAMEDMRKQGMARLAEYRRQGLGGSYAEMTDCAFCDGANDPFENR